MVTFLNGVAGKELSRQHAINSGKVFSQIHPTDAVWITSLVPLPDTKLYQDIKEGSFTPLSEIEMLEESKLFLENLDINAKIKGSWLTTADIGGELPRDRQKLLDNIQYAINNIDESKTVNWRSQIKYI